MDDEDKGFFILVLGVLAAVLLVVSWWAIQDDGNLALDGGSVAAEADQGEGHGDELHGVDHDHGDGHDHHHDHGDDDGDDHHHHGDDYDDHHDHEGHGAEADGAGDGDGGGEDQAAHADADGEEEAAGAEPTAEPEPDEPFTVADLIGQNSNLSSTTGLLLVSGMSDALAGDDPVTVLAPSNAALDGVDQGTSQMLLANPNMLADTLNYHVLPGVVSRDDLVAMIGDGDSAEVATLNGDTITLTLDGDDLVINGNATLSTADAEADNGIVHTIENVLIPNETALNIIVGLEPIQFASGSAVISPESEETLDRVVAALSNSEVNVTVEGHTDSQGDDAFNEQLSDDRARSVVNHLVANGVDEARLSSVGYGEQRPVGDNETEEGRAQNRRIAFRVER